MNSLTDICLNVSVSHLTLMIMNSFLRVTSTIHISQGA